MNRLQTELARLFEIEGPGSAAGRSDGAGDVRCLALALAQPADWALLSTVWRGVQAELDLPAPAIAVSGTDALQLWFSLEAPVATARAHAFLEALRVRFLPEVPASRMRWWPAPGAANPAPLPAQEVTPGQWSAFVAPDLAAVFAETPWLDMAPGEEGQAALLRGLRSMKLAQFEAALKRLEEDASRTRGIANASAAAATPDATLADADPRRFLARVMNDETVALALRVEAAKALLPWTYPVLRPPGT